MRQYKFRVFDKNIPKDTSTKELKKPTGMMLDWEYVKKSSYLQSLWTHQYPIMDFIGMYDIKQNPVYVGDIIKIFWLNTEPTCEEIVYDTNWGYYRYGNNPICELMEDTNINFEIIGNIYENPELC